MRYIFQQSYIWDGSATGTSDPNTPIVRVKARSEERARKKLPKSALGRIWILLLIETKETNSGV